MTKADRKLSRRASFAARMAEKSSDASGARIDPSHLSITDIDSVTLDVPENAVTVALRIPVGRNEGYAEYEEELPLGDLGAGYLEDAARRMTQAALRAVQERLLTNRPLPCNTCTAPCCGRALRFLPLMRDDVARLEALLGSARLAQVIEMLPAETMAGAVATLALEEAEDGEERCVFHDRLRCSIYEDRPLVCRSLSPWTCDLYERNPELPTDSDDEDEAEP